MRVRAYKTNINGKDDILFLEINVLGEPYFDDCGEARAWCFNEGASEPETSIGPLLTSSLEPIEDINDLAKFILKRG